MDDHRTRRGTTVKTTGDDPQTTQIYRQDDRRRPSDEIFSVKTTKDDPRMRRGTTVKTTGDDPQTTQIYRQDDWRRPSDEIFSGLINTYMAHYIAKHYKAQTTTQTKKEHCSDNARPETCLRCVRTHVDLLHLVYKHLSSRQ